MSYITLKPESAESLLTLISTAETRILELRKEAINLLNSDDPFATQRALDLDANATQLELLIATILEHSDE